MSPLHMTEMLFSSRKGWNELIAVHPTVARLFLFLVLPLSLLPPEMILHAGSQFSDQLMTVLGSRGWNSVAAIFFVAELCSFAAMGQLIKWVAESHGERCSLHDAYVLAAIAPVPMWLSALILLVPNLMLVIVVGLAGLVGSFFLIANGVRAMFHESEDVVAASIAHGVMAVGMLAWGILLMVLLLA